ncbi:DoxX family protein (plasmid) [Burkholderia thailandensis]|uniref:DoxX family protein n=1 Tax=Burkholderia thailandensis TaxID=57975 RepID=UPI00192D7ED5|nr:DoxX family protein [Burkholderia thailandensis]MBS2132222.1 DoxX family protein [Burkholderia thailandensis]QRA15317.1 DoxX family protein [Burkholderia thailandensis]
MPHLTRSNFHGASVRSRLLSAAQWLERVPYWLLAIPLRLAVATVFWSSAMTKLANWDAALELFRDEYRVPLLPPEIAAYIAVSIELSMPVLLVLGLGTRPAALVLLGMTSVIEIFVYPQAWPTHIQWAAMLLVLLCRGAGRLSLDHVIRGRWSRSIPSGESGNGP